MAVVTKDGKVLCTHYYIADNKCQDCGETFLPVEVITCTECGDVHRRYVGHASACVTCGRIHRANKAS